MSIIAGGVGQPNFYTLYQTRTFNQNKVKKAINACKKYNGVILDKTKKSNVIQITALRRDIDKMIKDLKKFGLVSVSRTGAVAMTRGDKIFN